MLLLLSLSENFSRLSAALPVGRSPTKLVVILLVVWRYFTQKMVVAKPIS